MATVLKNLNLLNSVLTPSTSKDTVTPTEPVPDPSLPAPEIPAASLTSEPDEEASASEPASSEFPTTEPPKKRRKKKKSSAAKTTQAVSSPKPLACPPSVAGVTPSSPDGNHRRSSS
nr:predicted GPI-anchored protein 58 [Parasteatoda tepidariorum]